MNKLQTTKEPSRTFHNQVLGAKGEGFAEQYLLERGFHLIERNWRCRYGELDLIMREGKTTVAVEVKTRSGTGFGSPLEAITPQKVARLRRLLLEWSRERNVRGGRLRIDGIGITLQSNAPAPQVVHLRSIS
ncbi:YraN family protein [Leucobacter denitrificans]|uniref:UPF0102 protein H9L06_00510 n=1 Tax=Leucobacter denitrificans TaxID=683042 RepID=A0A7G9S4Y8_9MICO|nr:YraN family protein [Leucobacter denitrificans]QNN62913.1 YraN family protein [Leucobacter denitrificans]